MKREMQLTVVMVILLSACAFGQNPALVTNINPSTDEAVGIMTSRDVLNGVVYFNGNDGSGYELWRTDGTTAGTYMVKDVPGTASAGGIQYGIFTRNRKIYFGVGDGVEGSDPWVSDGSAAGTFALTSQSRKKMSKNVENFVAMGSKVFFRYFFIDSKPNGSVTTLHELWSTDATSTGTSMVINSLQWMENMVSDGSLLIMKAGDGWEPGGHGNEPWRSDGTAAGTALILDICPLNTQGSGCGSRYTATTLNSNFYGSNNAPLVIGSTFYFSHADDTFGQEIWKTDGTAGGTERVTDVNPLTGHACPHFLTEMNGTLFFTADDGTHGMELWKYPLPNGPATLVKDIVTGGGSSEPIWLTPVGEILYFSAWTEAGGRELWRSDGTEYGTYQVFDIAPGGSSSNPNYDRYKDWYDPCDTKWKQFTVIDDRLYFAADDGDGYELWESNGTPGGTTMIANVNPNAGEGSSPHHLSVLGTRLLFVAYHPSYGNEWWVYNTINNTPPIAMVSASPTTGDAPLAVQFSSAGSTDPDGIITDWYWEFGDGGTSSSANPVYTFQNPGTYSVILTVTDDGYAQTSASVTIYVTSTNISMHVESQTVTKIHPRVNKVLAEDIVLIHDENDQPVAGAVVYADYYGPTSGSTSGTTDVNGEVTLESKSVKYTNDHWCFTVSDVVKSGYLFDPTAGIVGPVCSDGTPKAMVRHPSEVVLEQNYPNPFRTSTNITYSMPRDGSVLLVVTDMFGREVARLGEGRVRSGMHSLTFHSTILPAGMYQCRLETASGVQVRTMLLVK